MGKGNPCLPDKQLLAMAGIAPNGSPIRCKPDNYNLKDELKIALRIIDEQDACNRFRWFNLPCNLSSQELERLIYYKGQLAFFYMKDLDEFYFMPYALDGTIDFYGRFNTIHPVPMTAGKDEKETAKAQEEILSQLKLKVVYGMKLPEEVDTETYFKSAVLLKDYTPQLSQTVLPRQQLNECLIDAMSDCIPYMRTALISATGIEGVNVRDADEQQNVFEGARMMRENALKGLPWTPIIGKQEMQEIMAKSAGNNIEQFMLAMQSIDNLRLSTYGLENGGLFEKKAHILNAENEVNQSNVGLVMQDGLSARQHFCNIANSIWGTSMWVEPTQNEIMTDLDGDGVLYDRDEGEESGIEQEGGGEYDDTDV